MVALIDLLMVVANRVFGSFFDASVNERPTHNNW